MHLLLVEWVVAASVCVVIYAIGARAGHPCIAFRRLLLYARGYLS
jgi:hypothetical protein